MDPRPQPTAQISSVEETVPAGAKEDRHFVTALARGLDLLTCFLKRAATGWARR
jgi:hypothetical protein